MKYFSYVEPDENDNPVTVTLSEDEIRAQYWPYWYSRMCAKFGQEHVDENYCFQDCLDDWVVVNWAIEVTE